MLAAVETKLPAHPPRPADELAVRCDLSLTPLSPARSHWQTIDPSNSPKGAPNPKQQLAGRRGRSDMLLVEVEVDANLWQVA
jgi:hypothetical protein